MMWTPLLSAPIPDPFSPPKHPPIMGIPSLYYALPSLILYLLSRGRHFDWASFIHFLVITFSPLYYVWSHRHDPVRLLSGSGHVSSCHVTSSQVISGTNCRTSGPSQIIISSPSSQTAQDSEILLMLFYGPIGAHVGLLSLETYTFIRWWGLAVVINMSIPLWFPIRTSGVRKSLSNPLNLNPDPHTNPNPHNSSHSPSLIRLGSSSTSSWPSFFSFPTRSSSNGTLSNLSATSLTF